MFDPNVRSHVRSSTTDRPRMLWPRAALTPPPPSPDTTSSSGDDWGDCSKASSASYSEPVSPHRPHPILGTTPCICHFVPHGKNLVDSSKPIPAQQQYRYTYYSLKLLKIIWMHSLGKRVKVPKIQCGADHEEFRPTVDYDPPMGREQFSPQVVPCTLPSTPHIY